MSRSQNITRARRDAGSAMTANTRVRVSNEGVHPMRVVVDDGIGLAVEVAGSGPGLLLVHGFGGAKEDFSDHIPRLARDHTVVTFDHRGHGASDKPDTLEEYSFERLRLDTLAVADAVGLEQFRLLGHSMGGMLVRGIALAHPQRVDALIMMDTSPGPIPGYDPELMEIAALVAINEGKDALKALLDLAAPLDTAPYQRMLSEREGYQAFCDKKWADQSHIMYAALVRAIAQQQDDLDAMRELEMPILVIVGALDADFVSSAQVIAEAVPGARLIVIDDAGHSPQFENPAAWIDAMTEFLAALPVPTA
jgi:pimeloyl-ACP methyl ester carboxylesterase